MEELSCEVLVLGGGPAAMMATIAAMQSGAETLLVCKQSPGNSGNIVLARAGHSANFDPNDSIKLFLEDTLAGGGRCCMIQLRRDLGRFPTPLFTTPRRRTPACRARPSG